MMQKPFVFVGKPVQRKNREPKRSPKRGPEEEHVKKQLVLCVKSKFGEF
jgi:hypothetical protein